MPQSRVSDGSRAAATPLSALLVREIAISTIVNIAFNSLFTWLAFAGAAAIPLWGLRGVALDIVPAAFMPAAIMTFPITAILRARLRNGMSVTGRRRLPIALPRPLALRAVAIGIIALGLVALPVFALLAWFSAPLWSWTELAIFKLAFSVLHAAVVTPIVVLAALGRDRGAAAG